MKIDDLQKYAIDHAKKTIENIHKSIQYQELATAHLKESPVFGIVTAQQTVMLNFWQYVLARVSLPIDAPMDDIMYELVVTRSLLFDTQEKAAQLEKELTYLKALRGTDENK